MAKPFSHDTKTVSLLFSGQTVYQVPRYQRDYAWETEHVKDLFKDFADAFDEHPDAPYFLGQIITCEAADSSSEMGKKDVQDIIDGQQRLTTLFLYFSEGLRLVELNLGEEVAGTSKWEFDTLRNSLKFPSQANPSEFLPVVLPAKPGIPYLKALVNGKSKGYEMTGAPTEQRLVRATNDLAESFEELALEKGWSHVWALLQWAAREVHIFTLETESQDEALRHFLRLNDRGLNLEQVDIVKSLIFDSIQETEDLTYDDIDEKWNSAATTLTAARIKRLRSMSTLLKFLIGYRTGKFVSGDASQFSKEWKPYIQDDDEVRLFLDELPNKARAVVDLSKGTGEFPKKYDSDLTEGTRERNVTQHIEMLLASDNLSEGPFSTLLQVLEDRMLLSSWGPEAARDIEPNIHKWAKELQKYNNSSTTSDTIRQMAISWYPDGQPERFAKDALDYAFEQSSSSWSYLMTSQHERIRYFLARVNRTVDAAFNPTSNGKKLGSYLKKPDVTTKRGFHLDHVFPKDAKYDGQWKQSQELDRSFGEASRKSRRINSIGNLTLLYKKDNLEASNELPHSPRKKKIYTGQAYYLQKALSGDFTPESDWQRRRSEQLIEFLGVSLDNWDEEAIVRMMRNYRDLFVHETLVGLGFDSPMSEWLEPLE